MRNDVTTAFAAVLLAAAALLACKQNATSGCTKDSECKGDRVCIAGACQSPPAPVAADDPAPATPTPATATHVAAKPPTPRPGGPCTGAQASSSVSCRCPDGHASTMVCFGRSLTWSACTCPDAPSPPVKPVSPPGANKRWPCSSDDDCNPPYQCGFQGNCMKL